MRQIPYRACASKCQTALYCPDINEWFRELGQRWAAAARQRHAELEAPVLDPDVAQELLELARVAAHTQERTFAPLACYTAGIAVERLRRTDSRLGHEHVAAYIRAVREELEREASGPP